MIEQALGREISLHSGYQLDVSKPSTVTNQCNSTGARTILTKDGPLRIGATRDHGGHFEPLRIPKQEQFFTCFDDKIVSMYTRSMATHEILESLQEQYSL
ncbi:transposase [Burkholderia cenocepacia]|uniref:transposase n=1 Tax=Burkholderia cenocepacia TaxID=95486 RepID=UPI000F592F2F|nr:transposase [Burkholderia cenocepacia]RQU02331.1 hypothetical protein DF165_02175 [Burkholderia cenocepacia]RQU58208.1 hypothetical protein DF146_06080 [Burkholderia cenocepacia]